MPSEANEASELILDPVPSILIESLRDIGYSFETALADIVDNSLSANASEINIEARTSPAPIVAVVDDGDGLTRAELLDSMRMGSRDPKLERDITDLGRFGLGLKTASFSQCRKLTVASRHNGITTCFSWDLDLVVEQNEWRVQETTDTKNLPFIEMLGQQGTLVIWEKLDRVCGDEEDPERIEHLFNRHIDSAEKHLSLDDM